MHTCFKKIFKNLLTGYILAKIKCTQTWIFRKKNKHTVSNKGTHGKHFLEKNIHTVLVYQIHSVSDYKKRSKKKQR